MNVKLAKYISRVSFKMQHTAYTVDLS